MGFGVSLRAAEDREGWKGIVATSSMVPRRPPRLRDWDEMRCNSESNLYGVKTSPSLIRVSAVRMKKPLVLSYPLSAQRRLWSDWADAQADLSFRWAQSHFVGLSCRGSKGNYEAKQTEYHQRYSKLFSITNPNLCWILFLFTRYIETW